MHPSVLIPFRALVTVAVGLIGLAALAIGLTIWSLYADAIAEAERSTDNIALVLADQTNRSMLAIDTTLDEIKNRAAALAVITPEDFRERLGSEHAFRFLQDRLSRLSQADVITVTDNRGRLVNSTRQFPPADVDYSDRDYFQHFVTTDSPRLFVSAPVISRIKGTWILFFTKRINGAGGDFVGLVTIGVEINYFEHVYKSIASLAGQSFLLLRTDGTVLVRYPDTKERAGRKMPPASPWHGLAATGGFYRSPGYFDTGARIVAVRPVTGFPLVVDVAMLESAALATWHRRAMLIGAGTLLAGLCAAFLLRALVAQFHRLAGSEASLAEREARLAEKSRELESVNLRLDAALNNMSQGLCMFDARERLVVCNDRYLQMYGLAADTRNNCTIRELLDRRIAAGTFSGDPDLYVAGLRAQVAQGRRSYFTTELADGRIIAVLNQPMPAGGWVATHEDITERQRSEARIAHMARHDALTDLANRVLFREKMDEVLAKLRHDHEGFSVFVFDLDLFKSVNDSLGHPIGDALLKAVAQRLRACVGPADTVGRLGGDEFAIIQTGAADQKAAAVALAHTLLERIGAPYLIDSHQIVIGISIGIALAPADGDDPSQLLKNADLALYRAKSEGRNGFRFFEPEMDAEARLQRALEVDLRTALAREEFEIHYQPIYDIGSKEPCAAEALVRWRHRDHGLIPPDRFIPLAEEIGVIAPLGEWILRRACMDAAKWPSHVTLAVNLSAVQFRNRGLVDMVSDALLRSGLPPERLELEITESVLLQKNAGNIALLYRLSELGVRIVLDDFGTGYSSLSYLRMFPFKKIKIDKSFVAEIVHRADCAAIVCAMTNLAQSLDMVTTAEGVETWEQFELLQAAGCGQAQGYLFSRPQPVWKLDFGRDEAAHKVA